MDWFILVCGVSALLQIILAVIALAVFGRRKVALVLAGLALLNLLPLLGQELRYQRDIWWSKHVVIRR